VGTYNEGVADPGHETQKNHAEVSVPSRCSAKVADGCSIWTIQEAEGLDKGI